MIHTTHHLRKSVVAASIGLNGLCTCEFRRSHLVDSPLEKCVLEVDYRTMRPMPSTFFTQACRATPFANLAHDDRVAAIVVSSSCGVSHFILHCMSPSSTYLGSWDNACMALLTLEPCSILWSLPAQPAPYISMHLDLQAR